MGEPSPEPTTPPAADTGSPSTGSGLPVPSGDGTGGKGARGGLFSVMTGTRPGLERFLLASVPALAAGAVGAAFLGPVVGLSAGLVTLIGVMLAAGRLRGAP